MRAACVQAVVPDDPYAFLPKPEENNVVHTTVNFSDGRVMRISNTPDKLKAHLAVRAGVGRENEGRKEGGKERGGGPPTRPTSSRHTWR